MVMRLDPLRVTRDYRRPFTRSIRASRPQLAATRLGRPDAAECRLEEFCRAHYLDSFARMVSIQSPTVARLCAFLIQGLRDARRTAYRLTQPIGLFCPFNKIRSVVVAVTNRIVISLMAPAVNRVNIDVVR